MERKLLFLDIDGTILDRDDVIYDSTREALDLARKNGHHLFLCTGREKYAVYSGVMDLGFDDGVYAIGAHVICDGKTIHHDAFTNEMYHKAVEALKRHHFMYDLEANDKVYAYEVMREPLPYFWEWLVSGPYEIVKEDPVYLDNLDKISFLGGDCTAQQLLEELGDEFHISPFVYRDVWQGGEIQKKGVNKASGIQAVLDYLGADIRDTIGVGDSMNDLEMLGYCHQSVAMGNATDFVKSKATYIARDIKKDGLYWAFKDLGLI